MPSRREFLATAGAASITASLPGAFRLPIELRTTTVAPRGFIDITRPPDAVSVQTASSDLRASLRSANQWEAGDITVTTIPSAGVLRVSLASATTAVKRIRLRWRGALQPVQTILGDAWERAYGDLEWRGWVADRVMPWYFATYDGSLTHGYGVRTGPKAMCFWQCDPEGITLWADVRSGAAGVELKGRTLDVCEAVARAGHAGETSFAAIHAFCRTMCPSPRLPPAPLYGSNDWYWAYGKNSAASVRADAEHVVELSPNGANRPFAVIDDGWQPARGSDKTGVGLWDRGNEKFPDLAALAGDVKRIGARPGIWIRPLLAPTDAPDALRLPRDRTYLDPSLDETRAKVRADIARLHEMGYELIKHDYTTFDIFGRWGFQMGAAITRDGWTFAAGPTRTNAEVIDDLYRTMREAAETSLVIGCNTVSHLSAGRFEICRIGDDTSGTEWARTRKMGVNTLAFRGAQHNAFYVADADCVGVTNAVPWTLTRQWLDLLARSGTMLFTSLAPDALGTQQRADLKFAFAFAAEAQPLGEPLDWRQSVYPSRWKLRGREQRFDWVADDGAGLPP